MEITKKKSNEIKDFYSSLGRLEKGRFLLWAQLKTGRSQRTIKNRIDDNGWTPSDRESIERGIDSGSWRTV